ncbi:MAG TPA: allantoicase [Jiangellaceae bacterium]
MLWRELPDLALRTVGSSVLAANDETFAEKENLIRPEEPAFQPHTFGHHGQVMDGWESRRRRTPGHDWVIVRLGVPGLVRGVVVDTTWFTGNYPPECTLEAAYTDPLAPVGVPDLVEHVEWTQIVPRSALAGDTINAFDVDHEQLVTHVKLRIFPDGGVARLRVHGEPVGDPRWVAGRSFDLAAMEHGGHVIDASNRFYSAPDNLLVPGPARVMGDGWETARRRDAGNDWVAIDLATEGIVRHIEIDTTCFIGNAPNAARLTATDGAEVLRRVTLQRDAVNRFLAGGGTPVRRLRLDIYPDGGLARFRAFGDPTPAGRAELFARWYDHLPEHAAISTITGWGGADETWARNLAATRPLGTGSRVPASGELAESPGRAPDAAAWAALVGQPLS